MCDKPDFMVDTELIERSEAVLTLPEHKCTELCVAGAHVH